ncbi:cytochrome P450 [Hymenobacter qilianensis]|uniref:Cytochrome P450 n=1 Tax=Hymenobacter qilianensis TaxID=1385715 RepID=A0ACB5PSJ3_9BACT|nr:cytochrome P450 [Hymenobacter qilianensis]GGF67570.1 cytochrome P450 [Hymenobacter qilianensis]
MPPPHFASLPVVPRWKSLRNSITLAANPIPVLNNYLDTYGDTIVVYLGGIRRTVLTRDPGLVQHVLQKNHRNYPKSDLSHGIARYLGHGLLTSEGSYWLQQRRLIQPGFHRQRISSLVTLMQAEINDCLEPLEREAAKQGGAVEVAVHELMTTTAFRIIARSVFSNSLAEAQLQRMAELLTAIQAFYVRTVRQPYLRPWQHARGQFRRHDHLAAELRDIVRQYIRQRQQSSGPAPDDLLQMLLDARYEDNGEPMTEEQVLDEAAIILVAGHETSANALSWLWYLLAQHPEVVAKLRAEMDQVLGDRPATFADLPGLGYSLQVIQETMRLYPPAWILDRVAAADDSYNGLALPKGTLISGYLYGIHHSAKLWDEPEAFRPERFGPDQLRQQAPYAYIPFGGGPRLCIGNQFALTEMQLVLLEMLRRFEVERIEQPPVDLMPLITLRPRQEIRVRFRRRKA